MTPLPPVSEPPKPQNGHEPLVAQSVTGPVPALPGIPGPDYLQEKKEETPPAPPVPWWKNFPSTASTIYSAVIAIGGIPLVIGFVLFHYNTVRLNLGVVSVPATQYLTAGMIPTLIIAFVAAICLCSRALSMRLARWLHDAPEKVYLKFLKARTIRSALLLTGSGASVFAVWKVMKYGENINASSGGWMTPGRALFILFLSCIFVGACAAIPAFEPTPHQGGPVKRLRTLNLIGLTIGTLQVIAFPVLMGGFTLAYLFNSGVSEWPSEWGGLRTRMAYLDVKRGDLSEETRTAILPEAVRVLPKDLSKENKPVVRTLLLDIALDTGEYMLVRRHGAPVTPTYRIKKDTIQSVAAYGYQEPQMMKTLTTNSEASAAPKPTPK